MASILEGGTVPQSPVSFKTYNNSTGQFIETIHTWNVNTSLSTRFYIDVRNYVPGSYNLTAECDGQIISSIQFIKP